MSDNLTPEPTPEINNLEFFITLINSIPVFILPIPPVITTMLESSFLNSYCLLISIKNFKKSSVYIIKTNIPI